MIYNKRTVHSRKDGRVDTTVTEMDLDEAAALGAALARFSSDAPKPAKIPFPTGEAFSQATELLANACLNVSPLAKSLGEALVRKAYADEEIARIAAAASGLKLKKTEQWKEAERTAKRALRNLKKAAKASKAKKSKKSKKRTRR